MGGSTYPFFRFLRKTNEWATHLKNRRRLEENMAYLSSCKKQGIDPYEHVDEYLKKQRGKE